MKSRRELLTAGASVLGAASPALAAALRRTPTQVLGPFYPVEKPLDADADLTSIKGRSGQAQGQVVHVMGRVLNAKGEPVPGARLEIWQANSHGRYTHPSDRSSAPLDPHFEGYADLRSDADGRYRFKTIKPAGYPADQGMRAPHIHFDVSARLNRLVTQMYFSGEPLNEGDFVLAIAGANRKLLIADVRPPTPDLEPGSLLAAWDIVLENG
jgi:protocatechuate 3,4-dioxygenase, beta subunit